MAYTKLFNLEKELNIPEYRMDIASLVDVVVIALFLSFMASRFILAPGLSFDTSLNLPVASPSITDSLITNASIEVKVLTARKDTLFFYDADVYSLDGLSYTFLNQVLPSLDPNRENILLVKADKSISMETFVKIAELAKNAGFTRVQLAVDSEPSDLN